MRVQKTPEHSLEQTGLRDGAILNCDLLQRKSPLSARDFATKSRERRKGTPTRESTEANPTKRTTPYSQHAPRIESEVR